MSDEKKNPYIDQMKEFVGKQVKVVHFTKNREVETIGKLLAINFSGAGIILDIGSKIRFIPRYIHMDRPKEEGKK